MFCHKLGKVKYLDWDEEKNDKLKREREIGFEDVVTAIDEGNLLEVLNHHNPSKYPSQKIYVVKIEDYVYLVPFVDEGDKRFLKTIYPSRKMTKKYLIERRKK